MFSQLCLSSLPEMIVGNPLLCEGLKHHAFISLLRPWNTWYQSLEFGQQWPETSRGSQIFAQWHESLVSRIARQSGMIPSTSTNGPTHWWQLGLLAICHQNIIISKVEFLGFLWPFSSKSISKSPDDLCRKASSPHAVIKLQYPLHSWALIHAQIGAGCIETTQDSPGHVMWGIFTQETHQEGNPQCESLQSQFEKNIHSINQSINQPTNQPANQTTNQP